MNGIKNIKNKECKNCKILFLPKYNWQIYCSNICKTEFNYKKRKLKGRRNDILRKFGINNKQYNILLRKQNKICAICFKKESSLSSNKKKVKKLAVDHNHINNKIRGLLCQKCNTLIGNCDESIEILKSAIKYLTNNK